VNRNLPTSGRAASRKTNFSVDFVIPANQTVLWPIWDYRLLS